MLLIIMCSFLILPINCYKSLKNIKKILKKLKKRGPDGTNILEHNGYIFIHNILYFSGEITYQPLQDKENDIILCFNGEIYNYNDFGNYKSDTEMLLEQYKEKDTKFIKDLDGEFTFIIFDFKKKIILQSSDIFGTKPQWYNITDNGIIISSFRSSVCQCSNLEEEFTDRKIDQPLTPNNILKHNCIKRVRPNKYIIRSLETMKIIEENNVYNFDLKQHKDNYDDFCNAFDNAIKKRVLNNNTQKNNIGLCLSGGYDSGAISCSLNKINANYVSYSMKCQENMKILNERMALNKNKYFYDISQETYQEFKEQYQKHLEGSSIPQYSKPGQLTSYYNIIGDWAGVGLFLIFVQSKSDKVKIFFSGQGADEIYSDYGWKGRSIKDINNPNINPNIPCSFFGDFPDNLEDIYPWPNFFGGLNESFITKEECTASLFGIETRYPFLDKKLVQEFLWLTKDLKNKYYKAPLYYYLKSNNYPFEPNEKMGFKTKITSH